MGSWDYGLDAVKEYASIISGLDEYPIDPKIYLVDADQAPLVSGLMSPKLSGRMESSWKSVHVEDRLNQHIYVMGAAATASATTLNIVDSATAFQVGQLLFVPSTQEQILCQVAPTADDGTTSVYERGTGGSPATAIADGAIVIDLRILGKENGSAPDAVMTTPIERTFYAEWMDGYVYEGTWMRETQRTRYGDNRAYQHMKLNTQFKLDFERKAFFSYGAANLTSASATRRPKMSGALQMIKTYGGNIEQIVTLTLSDLETFLMKQHKYHKGSWSMFCGTNVWKAIQAWPRSYLQISQSEKFFGTGITQIITSFGTINLFLEPWWSEGDMAGMAFILPNPINEYAEIWTVTNPAPKNHRFKTGAATWYYDIETDNRVQHTKDSLLAAKGMEWYDPQKMGFFYGVAA